MIVKIIKPLRLFIKSMKIKSTNKIRVILEALQMQVIKLDKILEC
jgi:hypothetical protein